MKTKISTIIKFSFIALFMTCIPIANAQVSNLGSTYLSIDWQFNAPLGNDFSSEASGWGANIEAAHFITPRLAAGAFVSWHTNNEYIPRHTYTQGNSAFNTDAVNSLFQLPFGLLGKYTLLEGNIVPYVGLKIGTLYSEQYATFSNATALSDNNWGFFISPELGITFYPTANHLFGINLSGYYGYASNSQDSFGINGLNNAGFRLGIVVRL